MKTIFLQGLLWMCLLQFSTVSSIIEPGYLDFDNLPDTNFSCVGKVIGGYYADTETSCQMFHVCTIGQLDEPMDIRFLCLNGTVFDQETRVCERVDEVDCSKSEKFYHLNLELYGNTAPPIVEEPEVTEQSKPQSTSTTSKPTTTRTTRANFYTTPAPTLAPTTHNTPKVITSNQFPVSGSPDIRFNPEEINFRLTPGSAPIIKSPSVSYQQQAFNGGDSTITITTHTSVFKEDRVSSTSSTQKPKSVVSYGLQHSTKQSYRPYEFTYQQTENSDVDYHTDLPSGEYSYQESNTNLDQYDSKDYQSESGNKQVYSVTRTEHSGFVGSTAFPSSLKPPQLYTYQRTEKTKSKSTSVFPTLPPLTFSSPAPFSLTRHIETKRSNDNQKRPRIIVSASASVSDASGRRLNYSLGTIGTSHIIPKAPSSYDDYKEADVGLDPFYHDVPKVKNARHKREVEEELATGSNNKGKHEIEDHLMAWSPPEYVDDNYEPTMFNSSDNSSALYISSQTKETDSILQISKEIRPVLDADKNDQKITESHNSKEEILAGEQSATTPWVPPDYVDDNYEPMTYRNADNTTHEHNSTQFDIEKNYEEVEYEYYDYVDDNYEPSMYDTLPSENKSSSETNDVHTDILTTETHTEPSADGVTQESTMDVNTVTEALKHVEITTTVKPYRKNVDKLINKLGNKVVFDSREKYVTPTFFGELKSRINSAEQKPEYSAAKSKQTYISSQSSDHDIDTEINTTEVITTPLTYVDSTIYNSKVVEPPSSSDAMVTYSTTVSNPVTMFESVITSATRPNLSTSRPIQLTVTKPSELDASDSKEEQYTTKSEYYKATNDRLESGNLKLFTSQTSTLSSVSTGESHLDTTINPDIKYSTTQYPQQESVPSVTTYPDIKTTTELSNPTTHYLTTQQPTTDETTINPTLPGEMSTLTMSAVQAAPLQQPTHEQEPTTPVPTMLYTSAQLHSNSDDEDNQDTDADSTHLEDSSNSSNENKNYEIDYRFSAPSLPDHSNKNNPATISTSHPHITLVPQTTSNSRNNVLETTMITTTSADYVTVKPETNADDITTISQETTTATETPISSTTRYSYLRTREPAYKRYARTRPTPSRHRFSSHNINMSQSVLKLHSNMRITPASTSSTTTTSTISELDTNEYDGIKSRRRQNSRRYPSNTRTKINSPLNSEELSTEHIESVTYTTVMPIDKSADDIPVTDAPLSKSANPTEPKSTRGALLPTTPLSQTFFVPKRFSYDASRTFNCFGRALNRFYADPRDCRLFHYCTPGYTKTQVLDMKFVCDYGTYFDPDKLICTKVKPHRCK